MRRARVMLPLLVLLVARGDATAATERDPDVVVQQESECTWCHGRFDEPDAEGLALARRAEKAVLLRIAGLAPAIARGAVLRRAAKPLYVIASERPALPTGASVNPTFKLAKSVAEVEDEAIRRQEDAYYVRFKNVFATKSSSGHRAIRFQYSWGIVNWKAASERRSGLPPSEMTLFGGTFSLWAEEDGTRLVLFDARFKVFN